MLVVIVVHRHHGWVELLVASFLWKLAWCLLVPWKLVFLTKHSCQFQLRGLWVLCMKCIMSLAQGTYILPLESNNCSTYFGSLLNNPDQQVKRGLPLPDAYIFIRCFWLSEGALSAQIREFYLNYVCIFIYKHTGIIFLGIS